MTLDYSSGERVALFDSHYKKHTSLSYSAETLVLESPVWNSPLSSFQRQDL